MTPFDKLLQFLVQTWRVDVWLVAKAAVVLFLFLYLVFSLVVVRQIKLMSQTINGVLDKELLWFAKGLVGLALVVLVLALVIL